MGLASKTTQHHNVKHGIRLLCRAGQSGEQFPLAEHNHQPIGRNLNVGGAAGLRGFEQQFQRAPMGVGVVLPAKQIPGIERVSLGLVDR